MKVLIHGFLGSMGKKVYEILKGDKNFIVNGFDINSCSINYEGILVYNDLSLIKSNYDIIIDFSHYSLIPNLLNFATSNKIPLVLCTTGLNEDINSQIKKSKEAIPIFQSGNMSLGINVLIELAKIGAKTLKDFDIEIIERHHNKKLDAPSGTAYMIADGIKEINNDAEFNFGRHGLNTKRKSNEIGIHAIRGGSITGDHTILFAGIDETIEIKHQATSKAVFAKGAIEAAKFLINKPNGLYSMTDLIIGGK